MKKLALLLTIAAFWSTPVYRAPVVRAGVAAPAAAADAKPDPEKIEPAAVELAKRADAGDTAFISKLMDKSANADTVTDMIARIKRADVRKTFRDHLEGRGPESARLNYHTPSHFQVELQKGRAGNWEVTGLRFCR
jgi:hypothetical protein